MVKKPDTHAIKKRPEKRSGVVIKESEWNYLLLEIARCGGNVTKACEIANIDRHQAYHRREEDDEFARDWRTAEELGVDGLIDEGRRRAFQGVERPVYQGGKKVGSITETSDSLLMFMIKAKRPEYRDKSVEVNLTLDLAGRVKRAKERAGE